MSVPEYSLTERDELLVARVRQATGIAGRGPSDFAISLAASSYASKFTYWYSRVMEEAANKYRKVLIERINPFTKRIECEGLDAYQTSSHLVEIYSNRNFATAGGWAIEALAIAISQGRKSTAVGIDLEMDDTTGNRRLYVLKSSPVTRNSDILASLKTNARQAEKLIRQSNSRTFVDAVYGVAFGIQNSTYEDGVRRPSSIELWKELTGLEDDDEAINIVLAVASEGYREYAQESAERSLEVLRILVCAYICEPSPDGTRRNVDWDFLARRNMRPRTTWRADDLMRHKKALDALKNAGL